MDPAVTPEGSFSGHSVDTQWTLRVWPILLYIWLKSEYDTHFCSRNIIINMDLSKESRAQLGRVVQLHLRNQAIVIAIMLQLQEEERRRRRRRRPMQRRWWVRNWVARRPYLGQYDTLMFELEIESPNEDFKAFLRVEPAMFHELVHRLTPHIEKETTTFRNPICPPLRIAIALRFLASGMKLKDVGWSFRVPHNTISVIIREVCMAIIYEFGEEVVKMPQNEREWYAVANDFANKWQFPHCCGAIDGKHVAIQKPADSGTTYYNYKGFFSIVLMGMCDADYKFIFAAVGSEGSLSDRAIFSRMRLKEDMDNDNLNFPPAEPLRGDDLRVPFYFIGDDAFPLTNRLMKPYSRRNLNHDELVFNYRLSRARRVIENAYGILACRWGCLLTTINMAPENVKNIVLACICLHNIMRMRYPTLQDHDLNNFAPRGAWVRGRWRNAAVMHDIRQETGPAAQVHGKRVRTYLKNYFQSPYGRVDWQDDMV